MLIYFAFAVQFASFARSSSPQNATQNATSGNSNGDLVHGWISTDSGRGTSNILWSCLVTLFACTWSVQHNYIPVTRPPPWKSNLQKVVQTLIIMFAPEALITSAIVNRQWAKRNLTTLRRLGAIESTLTHGFLLTMRGLRLRSPTGDILTLSRHDLENLADVGGMNMCRGSVRLNAHASGATAVVDDIDLAIQCLEASWINDLRRTSEETISDLAGSDMFVKGFACVQALWSFTQIVTRAIQGLAITILELTAAAFIIIALIIYGVWWEKPQDCRGPILLKCATQADYDLVLSLRKVTEDNTALHNIDVRKLLLNRKHRVIAIDQANQYLELWWPLHSTGGGAFSEMVNISYISLAISVLFGAINCTVWNFYLPTMAELWIWRASSLLILLLPCLYIPSFWILFIRRDPNPSGISPHWQPRLPKSIFCYLWVFFLAFIYCSARLYMVVEMFISLRTVPASVYQDVRWSSYIPHV